MRIGIYGGSFNPIHFGHLITASFVYDSFSLDSIHLVVAKKPPHKNGLCYAEHRLEMTRLAVVGDKRFHVSNTEFREGQSPYTVDLLRTYRQDYPLDTLILIIGADSLNNIESWHRWQSLEEVADRIIVLGRPDHNIENGSIDFEFSGCPLVDISSTQIRKMIEEKRSIRYYVPENVRRYIETNKLYRS